MAFRSMLWQMKIIVRKTDDTRIRLISCAEPGIAATLNAGIDAARAPLIARCDADDLFTPGRLSRQAAWLETHQDYAAICGSFATIAPNGQPAGELHFSQQPEEITQELLGGVARTHLCTFMIRTAILRQVGGCRPFFKTAEDIDLQFRLAGAGRIYYEPFQGYLYRLHDESITHQQPSRQRAFFDECAKRFAHERLTKGADALQQGQPPQVPAADSTPKQSSSVHIQQLLIGTAWDQHARGQKRLALGTGLRACLLRPRALGAWKSLLLLTVKPSGRRNRLI